MTDKELVKELIKRFEIELNKKDRQGIYALTSREMAYNSNKIEGSTLTKEQTASLFDLGVLPHSEDYYKAKDIEEMNGHFLMFNTMLKTLEEKLSQELIKKFHYELKSGVFEDRANGYAIGDYKKRYNIIGTFETAKPDEVEEKMTRLLEWYEKEEKNIETLALYHAKYETIHPFQDGNGRTGRAILFRECLKNDIIPVIIEDDNRMEYLEGLAEYRKSKDIKGLVKLFEKEQSIYKNQIERFL